MLRRRTFLRLALAATAPSFETAALAAAWPTRPVHLIVGFSAGGNTDIVARLIGQWLSERFGRAFIVENRVGAATNIATEAVVRGAPDGHMLLVASTSNAINASLYRSLRFDFLRDTEPVAGLVRTPLVMVVNPELAVPGVPEFLSRAKANPGQMNAGSSGIGSPPHVAAELFKSMAGVSMQHVGYRGDAEAIAAVIGGHVHAYFATLPGSIEFIKAGKLRALAVTSAERTVALANVPAMAEFLPDFDATIWNGINAPKGTPADVVALLNKTINAGLSDAKLTARFAELGAKPIPGTPADYRHFIANETDKWSAIVKSSGARLD